MVLVCSSNNSKIPFLNQLEHRPNRLYLKEKFVVIRSLKNVFGVKDMSLSLYFLVCLLYSLRNLRL